MRFKLDALGAEFLIVFKSNGTVPARRLFLPNLLYFLDLHQFVNASPFPRITAPLGIIADPEEVEIISYADDLAMQPKQSSSKFRKGGKISKHDKLQRKGINIDFKISVRYL
jgi:hypothetical protein